MEEQSKYQITPEDYDVIERIRENAENTFANISIVISSACLTAIYFIIAKLKEDAAQIPIAISIIGGVFAIVIVLTMIKYYIEERACMEKLCNNKTRSDKINERIPVLNACIVFGFILNFIVFIIYVLFF